MSGIRRSLRTILCAVCSLVVVSGCANKVTGTYSDHADGAGPTVIGSDSSTESRVVAALYGELLTAAGEEVKTAPTGYRSPADTVQAVLGGRIDLTPAYESTMLRALPGGQVVPGDMSATLSMALPPGVVALPPAAAQRGVVLAVTRATARRHEPSIADLGETDRHLTLGGPASGDPDAPTTAALKKAYGVALARAGTSGTADVLVLRSTDPAITRNGLVVLTDPQVVIPPEHVFPLISSPAVDATGRAALARVNTLLTTEQLAGLTSSVKAGRTPAMAARDWLRSKGLLR
ncbi:glycine betaine ABC transporter substrate-binding protein [Streptomyces caeruleatus]|uniref:ABC transporter substrate-binding protein n=1 Tax=Streptomyces caeruleatus TaxID=661399 RepID=A0A101TNN8_9ACTN|nr:glycine betaine ABC transporter substrate-binding protein [Streptomyces caeruleatus]KUN95677.1 ABC transporter substrate-binding protein [Streptomyces caeruleatus]